MFVIFLRFAENRHLAGEHVDGHNDWIQQGIADSVFLLAGSVSGGQGGAIIAHGLARADVERRLEADPSWRSGSWHPRSLRSSPARSTTASRS